MEVGRRQRTYYNITFALSSELVLVLIGFFLPKTLMMNYSSEVNGAITSLQQIVSYFSLIEAGLSGAAIYSLYEPLAQKDINRISNIVTAAKKLYNKYGVYYLVTLFAISAIYPLVVNKGQFSYLGLFLLFVLIGVNGATQLFFIGKYKILLMASQRSGYVALINALSSAVYSLVIIILSYARINVVAVISFATIAYLLRAIAFKIIITRFYKNINFSQKGTDFTFLQQKDVLVQQLLSLIVMNSSIVILTVFGSSFQLMSIFTTYNYVYLSIIMLLNTVNTGISAGFGDLIAKKEPLKLSSVYKEYESLFQTLWSIIISCMLNLYTPFIMVYTLKITDADYVSFPLSILFTINCAMWIIRNQQSVIIVSAGKFRDIRLGSIVEAVLVIVFSTLGWIFFGIIGLMFGRLVSVVYRMIDFIYFNSKYIVKTPIMYTIKQIFISIFSVILSTVILVKLPNLFNSTYTSWILQALLCFIISAISTICLRFVFDRDNTITILKKLLSRKRL